MKKLLTLILCWLIAFSAMAETTFKAKTALSAAGGYITSQNKVDGSFEDGVSSWSASVGTIVKTANTEMQGNYVGVWSGTGAGTLDLQWTATASNTFEGTAQVNTGGEDDVYVCAYVGTTETGCKLIPVKYGIQKVSVVADSVLSSAFYLRLKHTGSDAFSIKVDDAKIEPWNLQNVQTVEQGSYRISQANNAMTDVVNELRFNLGTASVISNLNGVFTVTDDALNSRTAFTFQKKSNLVVTVNAQMASTNNVNILRNGVNESSYTSSAGSDFQTAIFSGSVNVGDVISINGFTSLVSNSNPVSVSLSATAIRDNVVQSYSEDRIGETLYSINPTAPNGYIPAMGQSIGKTSGTYQGEAYLALYKVAWNYATTIAGEPYVISSAKGANAQADFDAGKTITIDKRGLFVRTVGGNAGAVGAKQMDAFQGHRHPFGTPAGSDAGSFGGRYNSNTSQLSTPMVGDPIAGSNGIPRTASETRSINTAEYAYIRYAQSMPTLLALPTRSELFSANISASGIVSNATQNFVTSCTNATPSVCSLWSNFGVTPICWSHTLDITKRAEVTATTATTATVARTDTATTFNLFCHLK